MLTLSEFTDFTETLSIEEAAARFDNLTVEYLDSLDARTVVVYPGDLQMVEKMNGAHFTIIGREELTGLRTILEKRMFFDWYCPELADEMTTDALADTLQEWATFNHMDRVSADELLARLTVRKPEDRDTATVRKVEWLNWFLVAWEDAECREDGRAFGNRA